MTVLCRTFALRLALVIPAFVARAADIQLDADFPGGNIIVDGIDGNTARIHPALRDTAGNWFYWAFRVRGAAGRTIEFIFTQQQPVGVRGPAVSLDEGVTWQWLGRENAGNDRFTYAFPEVAESAMFSMGMPYTQANLDAFLKRVGANPALRADTLTTSRKGRPVERVHVGAPDAQPRHRNRVGEVEICARNDGDCVVIGDTSIPVSYQGVFGISTDPATAGKRYYLMESAEGRTDLLA